MKNILMKNILSYGSCKQFKGKDIKSWIIYHIQNNTSHTKDALKMKQYLNINDDKLYMVIKGNYQESERQYCVVSCE
jgi:hypothetical protein